MAYRPDGCHLVVGLGSAGSRHLSILAGMGVTNLAVVRSNLGPTRRPTPTGVTECTSIDAALELEPVMAVIATPTSLHPEPAIALLEAGVPVLVEKPLAATAEAATRMQAAASQSGAVLKAAYHLQFHPGLAWLTDLVTTKSLGEPMLLRATWGEFLPDWHPGEDFRAGYAARANLGGGPILTLSHVIDYAIRLLGPVREVSSQGRNVSSLGLEVPDAVAILMDHESGAVSEIELDYVTRPPVHKVDLRYSGGRAEWDVLSGATSCMAALGYSVPPAPDLRQATRDRCFVDQMASFLAALESGASTDMAHDLVVAETLQAISEATVVA